MWTGNHAFRDTEGQKVKSCTDTELCSSIGSSAILYREAVLFPSPLVAVEPAFLIIKSKTAWFIFKGYHL